MELIRGVIGLFAFVLLLQPDETIFVDVSEGAGINASHRAIWYEDILDPYENGYLAVGQAWGDFNNDGWLDLYVTGNLDPNVLYVNQGDGTFQVADQAFQVSVSDVPSGGAVWADYDNDGWRDLYVLNLGANRLFRNIGGTSFQDVTSLAGVGNANKGTSAAWGDYDKDGYLDLYVTNWSCHPACQPIDFARSQDVLYHNNGDGTFEDVSRLLTYERLLGSGFAVSFADYDNDGDTDIYVVNDKVARPIGNILWRNEGEGCGGWCWWDASLEARAGTVGHGMGLAIGDYDNDGDLDFYFSNMVQPMVLLQNRGNGTFSDVADEAQVDYATNMTVGWGTAFLDYDNDGWLDLYLAASGLSPVYGQAGMLYPFADRLFHNKGDGSFIPIKSETHNQSDHAPSMGLALADYDNDGHVDMVIGNWNEGYRLYRNQSMDSHHWLTVRLVGGGRVNRDAIGARVYLSDDQGRVQMREVKSGSSLGAGNDTALYFGLGTARPESVTLVWPDGTTHTCEQVPVDQIWQVAFTLLGQCL